MANVGERYAFGHADGLGFGELAKGEPLTAEMRELDLKDGQEVTLIAFDEDSEWPIIEWTDGTGINRITTVEPDIFDSTFQLVEA
jgi:hypothetical protein